MIYFFELGLVLVRLNHLQIHYHTSKFSTGSDDADTIPTDDLETSLLPNEAFENVLLNQRQFFYTNSNSNPIYQSDVYLSEIAGEDQSTMSLPKFAVVNMDGDELPEVVYQRGDYMGFIVLRYKDGDIYGYDVNYRGLTGLKKDGFTFLPEKAFYCLDLQI